MRKRLGERHLLDVNDGSQRRVPLLALCLVPPAPQPLSKLALQSL